MDGIGMKGSIGIGKDSGTNGGTRVVVVNPSQPMSKYVGWLCSFMIVQEVVGFVGWLSQQLPCVRLRFFTSFQLLELECMDVDLLWRQWWNTYQWPWSINN